jgi:putative spermidine/putrescine transport system permease protein
MMTEVGQPRPKSFYILGFFFLLFVAFLYGPMIVIFILSFQGPNGGMSFPMVGCSTQWFQQLLSGTGRIGDIPSAFTRSLETASLAAILTVAICVSAGMAFRRRFPGSGLLFYTAISSLVMPSLFVGFGIALGFKELGWKTGLFTSGLGAQLTWTLPFGLMITFATIGRFDRRYEEAATDLGANGWQRFRDIILPIILPGVIGVGLFGFTLSYDEFARSSLTVGTANTLPLEIWAMTTAATSPVLFALGTVTTVVSFTVLATALVTIGIIVRRRGAVGRRAATLQAGRP